jgi:hypothetical protein
MKRLIAVVLDAAGFALMMAIIWFYLVLLAAVMH